MYKRPIYDYIFWFPPVVGNPGGYYRSPLKSYSNSVAHTIQVSKDNIDTIYFIPSDYCLTEHQELYDDLPGTLLNIADDDIRCRRMTLVKIGNFHVQQYDLYGYVDILMPVYVPLHLIKVR